MLKSLLYFQAIGGSHYLTKDDLLFLKIDNIRKIEDSRI